MTSTTAAGLHPARPRRRDASRASRADQAESSQQEMSALPSIEHTHAPLGKRGAFEGVARRHGRRRNPARMTPPSSLRTPTNRARHHSQHWVRKVGRSIANSETPHPNRRTLQRRQARPAAPSPPLRRHQREPRVAHRGVDGVEHHRDPLRPLTSRRRVRPSTRQRHATAPPRQSAATHPVLRPRARHPHRPPDHTPPPGQLSLPRHLPTDLRQRVRTRVNPTPGRATEPHTPPPRSRQRPQKQRPTITSPSAGANRRTHHPPKPPHHTIPTARHPRNTSHRRILTELGLRLQLCAKERHSSVVGPPPSS